MKSAEQRRGTRASKIDEAPAGLSCDDPDKNKGKPAQQKSLPDAGLTRLRSAA
jgi:hypothetical protein